MIAYFYPYYCNKSGYYIQTVECTETKVVTKKELINLCSLSLRHPVLSKKEFFENLSTDQNGKKLNEFGMLGNKHYIIVKNQ